MSSAKHACRSLGRTHHFPRRGEREIQIKRAENLVRRTGRHATRKTSARMYSTLLILPSAGFAARHADSSVNFATVRRRVDVRHDRRILENFPKQNRIAANTRYGESSRFEPTPTTAARPTDRERASGNKPTSSHKHQIVSRRMARAFCRRLRVSRAAGRGFNHAWVWTAPHLHIEPGRLGNLRAPAAAVRPPCLCPETGDCAAPARAPQRSDQVAETDDRRDRRLGIFSAPWMSADSCAAHDARSHATAKSGSTIGPPASGCPGGIISVSVAQVASSPTGSAWSITTIGAGPPPIWCSRAAFWRPRHARTRSLSDA